MALIGETKEEPSLESGILDYKTFGSRNYRRTEVD